MMQHRAITCYPASSRDHVDFWAAHIADVGGTAIVCEVAEPAILYHVFVDGQFWRVTHSRRAVSRLFAPRVWYSCPLHGFSALLDALVRWLGDRAADVEAAALGIDERRFERGWR